MPVTCPVCTAQNPEGSRFCNGCGSRLPEATALAEERKTITALFCDLVGFTAASESADPEDVDRMLIRYFTSARRQIEAHGGVVEKFIGDAVVGVFGVPQAHEDDPERAVRAALRICEDAADLRALRGAPLRLRVGINTGEALVRLNITPGAGERFLAGDAVNMASRIQSVAPEMGVAVGEATYEATRRRFEYEELPPARVKGKAEPVRVFHPVAPRSRLGVDLDRVRATPFVGREHELDRLTGLFDKALAEGDIRSATIVGEPGMGKSRLVAELLAYVDAQPVLVTWRQGRCLPYGSGISFWALGEILKAHAGILESDPTTVAMAKLDGVLPDTDERTWFRERLLPLLGIEASGSAEREEQFVAWRRFLELIAAQRPTVLVFEDLHWADDAMLVFLEQLADPTVKVPMLVLGTTRPELFDRRPGYGGASPRIDLEPLAAAAAADLIEGLLASTAIAPELRDPLLGRAEGNPLFVEEFIRLLRDRDLVDRSGEVLTLRPGASLPVPESLQALLAARLDELPPPLKSMLADAAVIGKVFWSGGVAAVGERERTIVEDGLEVLARKEFVRRAPLSSVAGEREYAFRHVLTRDVAYAALPRGARAVRHAAAGRWIEATSGDRLEDVADVLAHHFSTALDLAQAVGDADRAAALEGPALRSLLLAGERALTLDPTRAESLLERALALTPPGHPDRGATLVPFARAIELAGRYADAAAALEEAVELAARTKDVVAQARAMKLLTFIWTELADPRAADLPSQLIAMLEPLGPSEELADAYGRAAARAALDGQSDEAIELLDRAATTADAAPFVRESERLSHRALTLGFRAYIRSMRGERAGLDDFREALRMAIDAGDGVRVTILYNNMAGPLASFEGPQVAARLMREGLAFAEARGLRAAIAFLKLELIPQLLQMGRIDEAVAMTTPLGPELEFGGSVRDLTWLRYCETWPLVLRGEVDTIEALPWLHDAIPDGLGSEALVNRLVASALAQASLGQRDEAAAAFDDLIALRLAGRHDAPDLVALQRAALAVGRPEYVERLTGAYVNPTPYGEHVLVHAAATVAEVRGDLDEAASGYEDAAARWERFGVVTEGAFARLGQGRCLAAIGEGDAARAPLVAARETFAALRATPSLLETDDLLAALAPRVGRR